MSIFSNPFFSISGQKERLSNVGATLKAAVTGKGVTANTSNTTVNKVLSAAASNPFTTAAVITPLNTLSAAKAGFNALPAAGKVATFVAAPVVAGAVVSNPRIVTEAAKTPSRLANVGSNVGEFSRNPSKETAKQIFSENPVIVGGLAAAGAAALGGAAVGAISGLANTAATRANTQALREGNAAQQLQGLTSTPAGGVGSTLPSNTFATPSPVLPQTQALSTVRTGTIARRKKKPLQNIQRQSVRVNVIAGSKIQSYINRRAY